MTFGQLLAANEITSGEEFELTDPTVKGLKLLEITVAADEEMKQE